MVVASLVSYACPPVWMQAERYVSPADLTAQQAAGAADEAQRRAATADDTSSRALKAMMGGTVVRGGGLSRHKGPWQQLGHQTAHDDMNDPASPSLAACQTTLYSTTWHAVSNPASTLDCIGAACGRGGGPGQCPPRLDGWRPQGVRGGGAGGQAMHIPLRFLAGVGSTQLAHPNCCSPVFSTHAPPPSAGCGGGGLRNPLLP